jgi:predicted RNA-binding protein with PIN domain
VAVYLIDGYNVLHQLLGRPQMADARLPEGKQRGKGHRQDGSLSEPRTAPHVEVDADLEAERSRLVHLITSYMGRTSDRAIIVFDSRSQILQKSDTATTNVQVYFGSFSRSADSIIEREVYALSSEESVIVVSSDYGLQKTTFLPNVARLSSRQFVAEMQADTRKIANHKNCIIMGHRVEERVDPETLVRLKALRDSLDAASKEPDDVG